ncbi:MAG: hypothetical protein JWP61_1171, partial [Friedmanniella sp.]|nr:hypothetical protein [Friedmanniella sp.]
AEALALPVGLPDTPAQPTDRSEDPA